MPDTMHETEWVLPATPKHTWLATFARYLLTFAVAALGMLAALGVTSMYREWQQWQAVKAWVIQQERQRAALPATQTPSEAPK